MKISCYNIVITSTNGIISTGKGENDPHRHKRNYLFPDFSATSIFDMNFSYFTLDIDVLLKRRENLSRERFLHSSALIPAISSSIVNSGIPGRSGSLFQGQTS